MENTKAKIKNLQNSIVQRSIIQDAYIVIDAKNYIDLIYKYCFHNNEEEIQEWFKIKDVILLSNLHYIKNLKDAYLANSEENNIEYKKILIILNEYQKYMKKNSTNYDIPYFDFENEIKIKESYQLNDTIERKSHDNEGNIYYHSCYNPNGKLLKINISEKTVKDSRISLFAVIHNLLIRTKTIEKTDYLYQMKLTEQEFNMVYYFQIIILNAI